MTVKEIFDLRKQGRVEEAYEAIRPMYAAHKGKYTTLCMFWTASDVFKLRMDQKRFEEAEKIYLALKRMLPTVEDYDKKAASKRAQSDACIDSAEREQSRPQVKAAGFLQYASSRLERVQRFTRSAIVPDGSPSVESHPLTLNTPQQKVLDFIRSHPGVSVPKLNEGLNIPSKSLERHISALIDKGLIEHRGSKKTGGYYAL